MIILFVVLIAFALYMSFPRGNPEVRCTTGHKWIYYKPEGIDDEFLICQKCNRTPSQNINEGNND